VNVGEPRRDVKVSEARATQHWKQDCYPPMPEGQTACIVAVSAVIVVGGSHAPSTARERVTYRAKDRSLSELSDMSS
jgi:hypothetical protein